MALKFDHNFVLVGVVPDNDFHDMDYPFEKAHGQGNEDRPYYADNLSVFYSGHFNPNEGEGLGDHVEAILRAYLASYHIGQYIYSASYWSRVSPYSGYHDYNSVDIARLEKALDDIKSTADAQGAKMGVILVPHAIDFQRAHTTGTNPLGPLVETWGQAHEVAVKDLLPEMDAISGGNFLAYSLCDGHWSERGNAVAAQILEPWIQQIYAGKATQTADAQPSAKAAKKSPTND